MLNRRQLTTAVIASPLAVSSANAAMPKQYKINGIPYPHDVTTVDKFLAWLDTVENKKFTTKPIEHYTELYKQMFFRKDDPEMKANAEQTVCELMAINLFIDAAYSAGHESILLIRTNFVTNISSAYIPAAGDHVPFKMPKPTEGHWYADPVTEHYVPLEEPFGTWCMFSAYMCYTMIKPEATRHHS